LIELGTVGLSAATAEEAHPKEPDTQQADRTRLRNSRDIGGRCNPDRRKDAPAAIDWLCRAFGFEKHPVVPGENENIAHAQLTFGNGMIMLGSARDDEFGRWAKPPREIGDAGTQIAHLRAATRAFRGSSRSIGGDC
jgi:hypothetical protein